MRNTLSRRTFLGTAAAGVGALALSGFAAEEVPKKRRHEIRAGYLRLGSRFEQVEPWIWDPHGRFFGPTTEVFLDSLDQRVQKMAKLGMNVVLLELMEGLRLRTVGKAVPKGAITPKVLNEHIRAWKALGMRTVPLVNFSVMHSSWMGYPARMSSTDVYYDFCRDVIKEVYDVLEKPAFIHLGLDDESIGAVSSYKSHRIRPAIFARRKDKVLWHDINFLIDQVEKTGAHAWMWGTGDFDGFVKNVSKSVLVSPGFVGNNNLPGEENFEKENRLSLQHFVRYAEQGFKIAPFTMTNSKGWYIGQQDPTKICLDRLKTPAMLVGYAREHVAPEKLYGFVNYCEVPAGPAGDSLYFRTCSAFADGLKNPMTIPPAPEKAPEPEKKA